MVQKIENTPCRKCGADTLIKWIKVELGWREIKEGLRKTCIKCGFSEMIEDLDKDNRKLA